MKFWTLEQYQNVLQYINDTMAHAAIQILFYSGIRFGEMLALHPADLDFNANTISITKSMQRKGGKDIYTPPKTENGIRTVNMPAAIMEELKVYMGKIYGIQPHQRIFPFTKTFISNTIRRCSAAANEPYIRIHDLRHSHVSLLIELGFSPHLIADRIGDTVQMVNNTYGHLYPNKQSEVSDRLNSILVSK